MRITITGADSSRPLGRSSAQVGILRLLEKANVCGVEPSLTKIFVWIAFGLRLAPLPRFSVHLLLKPRIRAFRKELRNLEGRLVVMV
jgi:hypothetical protein